MVALDAYNQTISLKNDYFFKFINVNVRRIMK